MTTIRAVVLGENVPHALFLAGKLKSCNRGSLTTLVYGKRLYCCLQCNITESADESLYPLAKILTEISVKDAFEENLSALGCPFTFIDDCDIDDRITLKDMKDCDGSDELLVSLFELESLRDVLALNPNSFKYAAAISTLLPYIKKSIFSQGESK